MILRPRQYYTCHAEKQGAARTYFEPPGCFEMFHVSNMPGKDCMRFFDVLVKENLMRTEVRVNGSVIKL